jgi:hypothetical protein
MRIDFIPQQITKFQISLTKKNKGQKMKTENKERIKRVLEIRRSNAATQFLVKKLIHENENTKIKKARDRN